MAIHELSIWSAAVFDGLAWKPKNDDGDGEIDKSELRKLDPKSSSSLDNRLFDAIDTSKNGSISLSEMKSYFQITKKIVVDPEAAKAAIAGRGIYKVPGHNVYIVILEHLPGDYHIPPILLKNIREDPDMYGTTIAVSVISGVFFPNGFAVKADEKGILIVMKEKTLNEDAPVHSSFREVLQHELTHAEHLYEGFNLYNSGIYAYAVSPFPDIESLSDPKIGQVLTRYFRGINNDFGEIDAYAKELQRALDAGDKDHVSVAVQSVNFYIANVDKRLKDLVMVYAQEFPEIQKAAEAYRHRIDQILPDSRVTSLNARVARLMGNDEKFIIDKSLTGPRYHSIYLKGVDLDTATGADVDTGVKTDEGKGELPDRVEISKLGDFQRYDINQDGRISEKDIDASERKKDIMLIGAARDIRAAIKTYGNVDNDEKSVEWWEVMQRNILLENPAGLSADQIADYKAWDIAYDRMDSHGNLHGLEVYESLELLAAVAYGMGVKDSTNSDYNAAIGDLTSILKKDLLADGLFSVLRSIRLETKTATPAAFKIILKLSQISDFRVGLALHLFGAVRSDCGESADAAFEGIRVLAERNIIPWLYSHTRGKESAISGGIDTLESMVYSSQERFAEVCQKLVDFYENGLIDTGLRGDNVFTVDWLTAIVFYAGTKAGKALEHILTLHKRGKLNMVWPNQFFEIAEYAGGSTVAAFAKIIELDDHGLLGRDLSKQVTGYHLVRIAKAYKTETPKGFNKIIKFQERGEVEEKGMQKIFEMITGKSLFE